MSSFSRIDREWPEFAADIVTGISEAQELIRDMSREEFLASNDAQSRAILLMGRITEATKHIPHRIRLLHSEVQWDAFFDLQSRVLRRDFLIDPALLWSTIHDELPTLQEAMRSSATEKQAA